jgi:hypothetical protein
VYMSSSALDWRPILQVNTIIINRLLKNHCWTLKLATIEYRILTTIVDDFPGNQQLLQVDCSAYSINIFPYFIDLNDNSTKPSIYQNLVWHKDPFPILKVFFSLTTTVPKLYALGFFLPNICMLQFSRVFRSPELKAQVSFSDRLLSIVLLSVRPSVCLSVNFYIFDFSRSTGPILTRLGTNDPWAEGILNCSNEGDCPSPRGDNSKRVKIFWNFKKSSSPEPAGQFQWNLI